MLDADPQLAAEAAADAGHDHPHLARRQVEHLGQHVLHVEGQLGVGPDDDVAVAVPARDGGARLGVAGMDELRGEAMLVDAEGARRSPPRRRHGSWRSGPRHCRRGREPAAPRSAPSRHGPAARPRRSRASRIEHRAAAARTRPRSGRAPASAISSEVAATAAIGLAGEARPRPGRGSARSLTAVPKRIAGRSSAVSTVRTPGSARALATSSRTMRACGSVLRRILPNSMPGSAKSAA